MAQFNREQAIREYTALMEAGPLAENEQALRALIEQAYAHGLYFDYDRDAQKYCLVSPEQAESEIDRETGTHRPDCRCPWCSAEEGY